MKLYIWCRAGMATDGGAKASLAAMGVDRGRFLTIRQCP